MFSGKLEDCCKEEESSDSDILWLISLRLLGDDDNGSNPSSVLFEADLDHSADQDSHTLLGSLLGFQEKLVQNSLSKNVDVFFSHV